MAGFLKRVSRITMGKINTFLDGAENPEEVLPMLLKELRAEQQKAIEGEATAIAAHKRRVQEYQEVEADITKWAGRAELAVKDGDDGLARTALENQVAAEKRLEIAKPTLVTAERAADQARHAREDLQAKVATLETKRDEIIARAQAAKQQEEVQKVLAGIEAGKGDSILEAVARMEDKVAVAEARADAYGEVAAEVTGGDTESKFRDLEQKGLVDERLKELKAKLSKEG